MDNYMIINKLQSEGIRNSSIEALRIVAMSMVVLHHFIVHAIKLNEHENTLYLAINPFFYAGVDIFFLISGYFLIKLNIKSLLKYVFMVGFFVFTGYLLSAYLTHEPIPYFIKRLCFPITLSGNWFLAVYLGLLIISPILNMGLKSLSDKSLFKVMAVYSMFTAYSCFIGRNMVNSDGYGFGQGVYLYCLGYFISRNVHFLSKFSSKTYLALAFFTLVVMSVLGAVYKNGIFWHYNSPLMIATAALMLIGFSRYNYSSKVINSIAAASVGVYILQDGYFGNHFLYNWLNGVWYSSQGLYRISIFAMVFIAYWIVAWVMMNIFNKLFISVIEPAISIAINRVSYYKRASAWLNEYRN